MSFIQVKKLGHKFNIKDKDGNVTGEKWAVKDIFKNKKGGDYDYTKRNRKSSLRAMD